MRRTPPSAIESEWNERRFKTNPQGSKTPSQIELAFL